CSSFNAQICTALEFERGRLRFAGGITHSGPCPRLLFEHQRHSLPAREPAVLNPIAGGFSDEQPVIAVRRNEGPVVSAVLRPEFRDGLIVGFLFTLKQHLIISVREGGLSSRTRLVG